MAELDLPKYLRVRASRALVDGDQLSARVYNEAATRIAELEQENERLKRDIEIYKYREAHHTDPTDQLSARVYNEAATRIAELEQENERLKRDIEIYKYREAHHTDPTDYELGKFAAE